MLPCYTISEEMATHLTKKVSPSLVTITILVLSINSFSEAKENTVGYVGSDACKDCHKKEYTNFMKYAKKARSFESIERLKKGLSDKEIRKCYSCHTTGYGRPGGFESSEKTPHLKNAGCEVCHGPAKTHVRTKSPNDIKKYLSIEDCEVCHTAERINAFRYKPMIHGGAH